MLIAHGSIVDTIRYIKFDPTYAMMYAHGSIVHTTRYNKLDLLVQLCMPRVALRILTVILIYTLLCNDVCSW